MRQSLPLHSAGYFSITFFYLNVSYPRSTRPTTFPNTAPFENPTGLLLLLVTDPWKRGLS